MFKYQIESFHLNLQNLNKLSLPSTTKFVLNGLDGVHLESNLANDQILNVFLNQFLYDLSNVTKLICKSFGDINTDLLTKLFSKFPKLQCLKLIDFMCDIDLNVIRKILPDLKAINITMRYYRINWLKSAL